MRELFVLEIKDALYPDWSPVSMGAFRESDKAETAKILSAAQHPNAEYRIVRYLPEQ